MPCDSNAYTNATIVRQSLNREPKPRDGIVTNMSRWTGTQAAFAEAYGTRRFWEYLTVVKAVKSGDTEAMTAIEALETSKATDS